MDTARARVIVYGRVQGVFFRHETKQVATSLDLNGWVKNNYDGTVEAAFEGERSKVESALEWCKRGPRHAVVENVDIEWEEPEGERSFSITY